MNIPAEKWYQAIRSRRSCRSYVARPLDEGTEKHLTEFAHELCNFVGGARAVLVTHNPDMVFKGIIGSYGKIKNPSAYVAFIGDTKDPHVNEKIGYLGEAFILEATSMGLATCWVGGFFKPEAVKSQIEMAAGEKVFAVSPVGWAIAAYDHEGEPLPVPDVNHKRKSLDKLYRGLPENLWPDWVKSALAAARLAPSAINRQPWRFLIEEEAITVSVDSLYFSMGISKRLDCGIAMLHLETGALTKGVTGSWDYLEAPYVAKFKVGS